MELPQDRAYYAITCGTSDATLVVSVTALGAFARSPHAGMLSSFAAAGDPDIYVSTMSQHPSTRGGRTAVRAEPAPVVCAGPTDYQWASTRFGSDTLTISPALYGTTYNIAVRTLRAAEREGPTGRGAQIFSAGHQNATYDLVASINTPTVLTRGANRGQPQP
jgi:hypothetical protein